MLTRLRLAVSVYSQGVTPFAIAAENGRLAVVEFLVERGGVNINDANRDGDTPLCVAACTGRLHVVRYLVAVGADLQRINHDGASACWIACWNGHLPLVQFLSSLDEVDVTQVRGWSPQYVACLVAHDALLILFCQANAQGFSCVYAAGVNGHTHVVEFMSQDSRVDMLSCPIVGTDVTVRHQLQRLRREHTAWLRRKPLLMMALLSRQGRGRALIVHKDGGGVGFELCQEGVSLWADRGKQREAASVGAMLLDVWTEQEDRGIVSDTIAEEDEADADDDDEDAADNDDDAAGAAERKGVEADAEPTASEEGKGDEADAAPAASAGADSSTAGRTGAGPSADTEADDEGKTAA